MLYYTGEIKTLEKNEIFVFGSNERGAHGKGAALYAVRNFGAVSGKGYGLYGQSFAIPTKDLYIKTLPLNKIKSYVDRFIEFAKINNQYIYYITNIGCGLAGYTHNQIAPMFAECVDMNNIILSEIFYNIISEKNG